MLLADLSLSYRNWVLLLVLRQKLDIPGVRHPVLLCTYFCEKQATQTSTTVDLQPPTGISKKDCSIHASLDWSIALGFVSDFYFTRANDEGKTFETLAFIIVLRGNLILFNSFDTKFFTSPRMRNVSGNTVSWDIKTFFCLLSTFVRHEIFPSVVIFWRRRSLLFTRSTASRNEDFRVYYYSTKLWSSQLWTQFKQLRIEAWKSQNFNGA